MSSLTNSEASPDREVVWDRYKKEVMAVLIVALLGVAAYGGYNFYSDHRDNAAAAALASAKSAPDFQKVIAEYPSTPAGQSAYLLLADAQRNEQKIAEANTTLQTFLDKFPKHELRATAQLAMAGNLEAMGKPDEALTAYQRLVAGDPHGFVAPIALYSQIHILKDKNQIAEARKVCETIMTDYRDSRLVGDAAYQLRLLKPETPPAPVPATTMAPLPPAAAPSAAPPAQSMAPAAPPAPATNTSVSPKKP
jgi:predicted negative regulator of RcsB-dependent stress response